jgi:putative PIN family toxin of toxin-antitoxin system
MIQQGEKLRVVIDCNTLLQGVSGAIGPAAEILRRLDARQFELLLSRAVLREWDRVLRDETVRSLVPLADADLELLLRKLRYHAHMVARVTTRFRFPRDPGDEAYLNLALTGKAHFLVTRDRDLLDLMTGTSVLAKQFRARSHPLRIVTPVAFVKLIRS